MKEEKGMRARMGKTPDKGRTVEKGQRARMGKTPDKGNDGSTPRKRRHSTRVRALKDVVNTIQTESGDKEATTGVCSDRTSETDDNSNTKHQRIATEEAKEQSSTERNSSECGSVVVASKSSKSTSLSGEVLVLCFAMF